MAVFTVALSISTAGLWIVTWRSEVRQGRHTVKSLSLARRSADAAKHSADIAERALVLAERPYIVCFRSGYAQLARDPNGLWIAYVEYTVANYGRTPAIIEEVRVGAMASAKRNIVEPLTIYEDNPLFITKILAPRERTKPIRYDIILPYHSDAEPEPLNSFVSITVEPNDAERDGKANAIIKVAENKKLFFRVTVKYRGPFSTGHETGVCWTYDTWFNCFDIDGKDGNYER